MVDHEKNARSFLDQQHQRLCKVEEDLIRSTEHILPVDSKCWTLTELSELCRSLHSSNIQRMRRLHNLFNSDSGNALQTQKENDDIDFLSPQWTMPVRQPLERVVETDNETDGTMTPSAYSMFTSPPLTSSTQKAVVSGFPRTPMLSIAPITGGSDNRKPSRTSPSPAKAGAMAMRSPDFVERWRLQRLSINQINERTEMDENDERFDTGNVSTSDDDDDDSDDQNGNETFEFSVATGPTVVAQSRPLFRLRADPTVEKGDDPLIDSQPCTDGEKHDRSEKSDDYEDVTMQFSPAGNTAVAPTGEFIERKIRSEVSNVVAVSEAVASSQRDPQYDGQVQQNQNKITTKKALVSDGVGKTYDDNWGLDRYMSSSDLPRGVSSEVLVTTSPLSAAATELTMDEAIQSVIVGSASFERGDQYGEISMFGEASEAETPILDRYRLEPDDNTIGVKVVPNPRGCRRREINLLSPHRAFSAQPNDSIQQSRVVPRLAEEIDSSRNKITYRKTPHPKSKHGISLEDVDEENVSFYAMPEKTDVFSHDSRIPLKDIDPSQAKTPACKSKSSLSKDERIESLSRTPLTRAWMAKYMSSSEISHLMDSMELSETQPSSQDSHGLPRERIHCHDFKIRAITLDEYKNAARAVQMQVSADEVNVSIRLLNSLLGESDKMRFTEDEACAQLQQQFTLQKSKSLLMSLCHWRRILVRLTNGRKEFQIRSESTADSTGGDLMSQLSLSH